MSDVEGLRQEITEALAHHSWCWIDRGMCTCIANRSEDADRLLPVVTAWAERVARARAAEAVRAVADGTRSWPRSVMSESVAAKLRAQAWRLADDGRPRWAGTVVETCIRDVALGRIASHSSVTEEMVAEWKRLNLADDGRA